MHQDKNIEVDLAIARLLLAETKFHQVYDDRRNELGYWMSHQDLYNIDKDLVLNYFLQRIKWLIIN